MNIFQKHFFIQNSLKSSSDIVKWWESKRIFYNFLNLIFLAFGLSIIYLFCSSLLNFFLLPFIIFYGLILNIVYFLGWIILVVTKKTWTDFNITLFSSIMLILFYVLSCFTTLMLCIIFIIFNIP